MHTFDRLRAMVAEAHRYGFHIPGQTTHMDHPDVRAYRDMIDPRIDQIEADRAIVQIPLVLEVSALLGRNWCCVWYCAGLRCEFETEPNPGEENFQLPTVEITQLPPPGQIVFRHCQEQALNPFIKAWVNTHTIYTDPWGCDGIEDKYLQVGIVIQW